MEITEALKSLEKSWSREEVLEKIKNGQNSDEILNDFFKHKQKEIEILTTFINPEDKILLSDIENLSNIESKLINKIKNYSFNKNYQLIQEKYKERELEPVQKKITFNLGLFMMKWSNKFVFISLLIISAIALSKQA